MITQTILASSENRDRGIYGNCLQAAVCSLLDWPLERVPHFGAFSLWREAMQLWCRGEELDFTSVNVEAIPDEPCILIGHSPRGHLHAVVGHGTTVTWDPHPSRDGLTDITGALLIRPEAS